MGRLSASTENVFLSSPQLDSFSIFIIIVTALTMFRMIQRVVETLPLKFAAMLSRQQIQKDINISMCALTVVFKCLEVPQVSSLNDVRCYVNL
jgi:hypothetical protein